MLQTNIKSMLHIQRTYQIILGLFWFSTALPMSLAILLMMARGLTLFEVNLVMGIYSLTIVLLELPTGGLADAIGRKPIMLIAYTFILGSKLAFLFAFSLPAFLLNGVLFGVGRALASGALDAWFVDALQATDPKVDLQPILARANNVSLIALASGMLIGSLLPYPFEFLPPDGQAILTPFAMPQLFAIGVDVILLMVTFKLMADHRPFNLTTWQVSIRQTPTIIHTGLTFSRSNAVIRLLLGATLINGIALMGVESLQQPFFADLLGGIEGNSLFFGLLQAGYFGMGMIGNLLSTPLSRWLKQRYGLLCGMAQALRGSLLMLLALHLPLPLAVSCIWLNYLNLGLLDAPSMTLLNHEIPAEQRSAMLSIVSLTNYLGGMLGNLGLGYLATHYSIGQAWFVGGVSLLLSVGLWLRIDKQQQKQTKP